MPFEIIASVLNGIISILEHISKTETCSSRAESISTCNTRDPSFGPIPQAERQQTKAVEKTIRLITGAIIFLTSSPLTEIMRPKGYRFKTITTITSAANNNRTFVLSESVYILLNHLV